MLIAIYMAYGDQRFKNVAVYLAGTHLINGGKYIMIYMKQFLSIMLISFIGEVLHHTIPLPIPASIYGLIIMFLCLILKIFPCSAVRDTGKFLIDIMPLMFIPAAVGLIVSWQLIEPLIIPYSIITIISTISVMVISGKVTQFIINHKRKADDK